MKSKEQISERESRSVSSSFRPHGLYSIAGQTTGVASLSLLQGRQGLNPCLPHCRQILYRLSHQGIPRILEWVAYPFSSVSSRLRNQTGVSCIAGRFFNQLSFQPSRRHGLNLWVRKIPWRRKWQPIPIFLPRTFHRQRSLQATVYEIIGTFCSSKKYKE